jgi:hypothetical protein
MALQVLEKIWWNPIQAFELEIELVHGWKFFSEKRCCLKRERKLLCTFHLKGH